MLSFRGIEITPRVFYTAGMGLFAVMALMNTIGFVNNFQTDQFNGITETLSSAATVLFNYLLFGFFYYLRSNLPPANLEKGSLEDMEILINEKEKKEVKKK